MPAGRVQGCQQVGFRGAGRQGSGVWAGTRLGIDRAVRARNERAGLRVGCAEKNGSLRVFKVY